MNNVLTDLTCNRCGETFRRKPAQKDDSPCPNCGSVDLVATDRRRHPETAHPG